MKRGQGERDQREVAEERQSADRTGLALPEASTRCLPATGRCVSHQEREDEKQEKA